MHNVCATHCHTMSATIYLGCHCTRWRGECSCSFVNTEHIKMNIEHASALRFHWMIYIYFRYGALYEVAPHEGIPRSPEHLNFHYCSFDNSFQRHQPSAPAATTPFVDKSLKLLWTPENRLPNEVCSTGLDCVDTIPSLRCWIESASSIRFAWAQAIVCTFS